MTFKKIHFKIIFLLVIYFVVTQSSFFAGVLTTTPILLAFLVNIFFSILFGVTFLYIFDNEDLFGFAKQFEKDNRKKEQMWLHRFKNFGKSTIVFLIGILLGPLFAAITLKILLPKYSYKYQLIIFTSIVSAVLWLGLTRGIISFTIPFFR